MSGYWGGTYLKERTRLRGGEEEGADEREGEREGEQTEERRTSKGSRVSQGPSAAAEELAALKAVSCFACSIYFVSGACSVRKGMLGTI